MVRGSRVVSSCLIVGAAIGIGIAGSEMGQVLWEQAVQPRSMHDMARAALVQEIPLSKARMLRAGVLEAVVISAAAASCALDRRHA